MFVLRSQCLLMGNLCLRHGQRCILYDPDPDFGLNLGDDIDPDFDLYPDFDLHFGNDLELELGKLHLHQQEKPKKTESLL